LRLAVVLAAPAVDNRAWRVLLTHRSVPSSSLTNASTMNPMKSDDGPRTTRLSVARLVSPGSMSPVPPPPLIALKVSPCAEVTTPSGRSSPSAPPHTTGHYRPSRVIRRKALLGRSRL